MLSCLAFALQPPLPFDLGHGHGTTAVTSIIVLVVTMSRDGATSIAEIALIVTKVGGA